MAVKIVHVAVGAVVSPDGKILIARRAADAAAKDEDDRIRQENLPRLMPW